MSTIDEKSWHTCLPDVPPSIPISSHMCHLPSLHLHTLPSTAHLDLPLRSPRTPKASYTIPSHAISQDIQFLQSFKSLTTLNVEPACGVYWKREHVEALPNTLTSLSLNHTSLSCDALLLIPTSCPALQHVSLRHTSTLTDSVLAQLLPHLHLKSLDLSYCDGITSIQPILSTDHVSSLISLSLAHTSCDDQALIAMRDAHMNERITSLSLAGLLSITTQGIRTYLTSSHPSPLLHLNLSGCTSLDDSAIEMVASSCGSLVSLDMSGMDGITDDAVTFLAAGCHKLIKLRHFDCDISDDSLFILMKANPKIRLINTMRRIDDDEFADDDTHVNHHDDEQDGSGEEDGDDPEEEQQQNGDGDRDGDGDGEQDDWDRHLSELRIRSESIRINPNQFLHPSRPQ